MIKIKFMLEYNCCPIWIESEGGELLGNGLPNDMVDDQQLFTLVNEIHKEFDDLYENNNNYFGYQGFKTALAKREFFAKVNKTIELLKQKAGSIYEVHADIDESNF